jgi:hypothetical protein
MDCLCLSTISGPVSGGRGDAVDPGVDDRALKRVLHGAILFLN